MKRSTRWLSVCGLAQLMCFVGMALLHDLSRALLQFQMLFLVAFVVYLLACWLVLRLSMTNQRILIIILGFGLAFRMVLLMLPPTLSDDIYRSVWDAKVMHAGLNPYLYTPNAPELEYLRDEQWQALNHKHQITPYPPLDKLNSMLSYRIGGSNLYSYKLLSVVWDVLLSGVVLLLLRHFKLDAARVLIYVWHPLPVIEFALSGHNDSLMVFWMAITLLLVFMQRRFLSGVTLGLAVLSKFMPLLLVPLVLWRWRWSSWPVLLGFTITLIVGYLPFVRDGWQIITSITMQQDSRFNESIYYVIERLLRIVTPYSELITSQAVLILLISAIIVITVRTKQDNDLQMIKSCVAIFVSWYLVTPILEPWYITWVLPFFSLLLRPGLRPAWMLGLILLSGLVTASNLSYLPYGNRLWLIIRSVEYIPLYVCLLWSGWPIIRQSMMQLRSKTLLKHRT